MTAWRIHFTNSGKQRNLDTKRIRIKCSPSHSKREIQSKYIIQSRLFHMGERIRLADCAFCGCPVLRFRVAQFGISRCPVVMLRSNLSSDFDCNALS